MPAPLFCCLCVKFYLPIIFFLTDLLANSKKTDNGGLFGKKSIETGRMTFVPPFAE